MNALKHHIDKHAIGARSGDTVTSSAGHALIYDISQTARLEREGTFNVNLRVVDGLAGHIIKGEADASSGAHTREVEGQRLGHVASHHILGNGLEARGHIFHLSQLNRFG